ncbi:hypothetical protein [Micromonospora sp. NPDC048843]|uniref:hypothetical protein n=1 Tax=Micromonospora sp. NPDC048843 TaxID=3155389 RepID=UPI0033E6D002
MDHQLSESQKNEYLNEIRKFLAWAASDGLGRMSMILRMTLPSVHTDAQGLVEMREYLDVVRREGLTPDVGIPVIKLLIQTGKHVEEFGAPMPSHEAVSHLSAGRLGHGGGSLL